jgi:hypothetical protein
LYRLRGICLDACETKNKDACDIYSCIYLTTIFVLIKTTIV